MTLSTLLELTQDPEYRRLPRDLALINTQESDSWSLMVDHLATEGVKECIWKTCQLVAVLFDTYKDTLPGVRINVDVGQDVNDSYLRFSAKIHDQWCYSSTVVPNSMVIQEWKQMGDLGVMKDVLTEVEGMGSEALIPKLGELKNHLAQQFTSAQQARQLAQSVAPEINAWARAQLLDRIAKVGVQAKAGGGTLKF